jgi:hypothetical protein
MRFFHPPDSVVPPPDPRVPPPDPVLLVHFLTEPRFDIGIDSPKALLDEQEEWYRDGDRLAACRAIIICHEYDVPIPDWVRAEAAELAREELGLSRTTPRERGPHADYNRRLTARKYQIAAFTAVELARKNGYRGDRAYEYALKALRRDGFENIYKSEESLQVVHRKVLNWEEPPQESMIDFCRMMLQIEFNKIRAEEEAERHRRE